MKEMQHAVRYSFVVPVLSDGKHMQNFLESLEIQEFDENKVEFIFPVPGNNTGAQHILQTFIRKHPAWHITFFPSAATSIMDARNEGITRAKGEILVFTEDDVRLEQNYLQNLEKETAQINEAFAGGGKILPVFEQQKPPWMIKFFMPLLAEVNLKEKHKTFPAKLYPFGINMLVHRAIFDRLGLFDPSPEIKHGPEHSVLAEKKFIDKVRKAGYPVYYFHNLVVWHYIPPEQLNKKYIRKQAELAMQVEISRVREQGTWHFLKFLGRELLKYLATAGIGLYYLVTTQWEKLKPLFQFRYWSLKTLLRNFPKKN